MRKFIYSFAGIAILTAIIGADFRRIDSTIEQPVVVTKKKCLGYTIIEFGKGIDCNGDTVKLVKRNGIQVLAHAN
jgi:hypothetical protein